MHFKALAVLSCGALVSAWLPGDDKVITSSSNVDLFNRTPSINSGSKRWLPGSGKLRGVNLGSVFIAEPWLMGNSWGQMGCGDQKSEFDCVLKLGQQAANSAFKHHWDTWITQSELQEMVNYGLNTIRIPVG